MNVSWYQRAKEFKSPAHVVGAFLLRSHETLRAENRRLRQPPFALGYNVWESLIGISGPSPGGAQCIEWTLSHESLGSPSELLIHLIGRCLDGCLPSCVAEFASKFRALMSKNNVT